jgi:hypothetical protein
MGADTSELTHSAPNAMNHILANYDSYEVLVGASEDPEGMSVKLASLFLTRANTMSRRVLVGVRDDGVTPFAMFWKHGLHGMEG